MQLIVDLQKLKQYAAQQLGLAGEIQGLRVTKLTGGMVATGLYRHDLALETANGFREASFVQKFTHPGEVQVMQALGRLPQLKAIPHVVDFAWSETSTVPFAHWYIAPFYSGPTLTFEDTVPLEVVRSLAHLHAHFLGRVEEFDYLFRVEANFFRRTFDNALEIVERAEREKPHPIFTEAHRELIAARENERLYQALASLPLTLTHGDVHPGNIIQPATGPAILIDWGNARVAPAMLDVANLIKLGSESWQQYLSAWAEAAQEPLNSRLARLGYHWATLMVNAQYLPYAVDFTPLENVVRMITKIVEAQKKIAGLLD
jgi:aminoglycoside phosphotransferase (APT) family kinase protein